MKIQTPNAIGTKNALFPALVLAPYGANVQAATTSACSRPPQNQPPGPGPVGWPGGGTPPSSCPGVPPLATEYGYNVDGSYGPETARIPHDIDCDWNNLDDPGTYAVDVFLVTTPTPLWRALIGPDTWEKTTGADPVGVYSPVGSPEITTSVEVTA